ncbi:MAG: argininosuccinate lyase, partial [Planctomycetes bacterium]|nr:argininosuccinate lyase [Planctomycetota bacterium]
MSRLWDKGEPVDDLVLRYTVGDDHVLDARLVPYDVKGSIAHARGLVDAGHLTAEEFTSLSQALEELALGHAAGEWSISREEEDCHTALESRLTEGLGDLGKKIHLGRSRNDQVLAALRLLLDDAITELRALGEDVVAALESLAAAQSEVPLPGYTHQQRAMP